MLWQYCQVKWTPSSIVNSCAMLAGSGSMSRPNAKRRMQNYEVTISIIAFPFPLPKPFGVRIPFDTDDRSKCELITRLHAIGNRQMIQGQM